MANTTKLTITQAATRLNLGYRRVRQLIQSGELNARADYAASGRGRPKWSITPQAVAALKQKRAKR